MRGRKSPHDAPPSARNPALGSPRQNRHTDPPHTASAERSRTVAWHIAHQPFGVVAGKIQYKHAQVAIFEGYAGSSASGFRAEIEDERQLARLETFLDRYED
jgi:hypothetical protein